MDVRYAIHRPFVVGKSINVGQGEYSIGITLDNRLVYQSGRLSIGTDTKYNTCQLDSGMVDASRGDSGGRLCRRVARLVVVGSSRRKFGDGSGGSGEEEEDPDYFQAGLLYCLASWVEGWAEPAVFYCLGRMDSATRVQAEGLATLVKTFGTVVMLQPSLLG